MESIWEQVPDTISIKWLIMALVLIFGIKFGMKGLGLLKQISTGMLVAALLFMSGLGGLGYSIGDLAAGSSDTAVEEDGVKQSEFNNEELIAMAKLAPSKRNQLLNYAAVRDSKAIVVVNEAGKIIKVHPLSKKLQSQIKFTSQKNQELVTISEKKVAEVKEVAQVEQRRLPIQWLWTMLGASFATAICAVVLASRTAGSIREKRRLAENRGHV